ncbi:MAG: TonB-dependent receptor [Pseudomonadota bacterium]|nr:TonB-dependent receptor [Pseudomonadota bacterium]
MKPVLKCLGLAIGAMALGDGAGAQAVAFGPGAAASQADSGRQRVEITAHYQNGVGTSGAASQGTVRGERLTDLPLLRPGEVLETVPGLVVTQHSGDGKANQYFLRGYNLDHGTDFATFVEGVPINMPTNAHGQGYTDLNFLVPELVEKIDYRKGPYFAEDGDFSSAGSARIKYVDSLPRGILSLTAGDNGYRRMVLAGSASLPTAGSRVLGALEIEHDNGPWTTPEGVRKYNGVLRVSDGTSANGWSADALAYTNHWTSTDQVPLELIESGRLGRFSALDPTDGGNSVRDIVTGEWHTHGEHGYSNVSAYAEHYKLELWSNFTYFEADPVCGDQFEQQESRNTVGGQGRHGWQHALLGNDSTTEAGFQVRHDHVDVGLFDSRSRVPFATVGNDRVSETEAGAYVQNTTAWLPWLRTLLGVRADHVDMNVRALQTPADSGHVSANKLSPKASLVFGPWARTEFFANAGRGFHSNDARGVAGTARSPDPVPAFVASKGEELGLRTEIVPGLQTSLAFWRLDSDSELVYTADQGGTEPKGASKRHGIELNNHLVLDRWLLIDADMAWTHARYADANANGETGRYIGNAVSRVGLFGVTVHELGPWSAGFVTRFIGAYPLSRDGALTTPSAIVSNLLLKRTITPNVTLQLDVLNVFDRKFYDIAYQQDYRVSPTAAVNPGGVTVHPGEPREFRAGVNFKL